MPGLARSDSDGREGVQIVDFSDRAAPKIVGKYETAGTARDVAAAGVLHALRDWLPQKEMTDLAAQLPVLIRGIYFEGWKPLDTHVWDRKKDDFIARVQHAFSDDVLNDPEAAVMAVFRLLDRHVSQGEIEEVRNSMKKPLRELWPAD